MTARALVETLKVAGPNPTRANFVACLNNTDLQIEGLRASYRPHSRAGLSLVDHAIVTRQGQFCH